MWDANKSPLIAQVMTDYWKPYEHFVPPEKHIQSKAETFTVEGDNSLPPFSGSLSPENEMLQQKRIHAEVFRHALDG